MGKISGGRDLNSVRLPDDKDTKKINYLIDSGKGVKLESIVNEILGYEIEEIVILAINIAIEQHLEMNESINIDKLVRQYLEWQETEI